MIDELKKYYEIRGYNMGAYALKDSEVDSVIGFINKRTEHLTEKQLILFNLVKIKKCINELK